MSIWGWLVIVLVAAIVWRLLTRRAPASDQAGTVAAPGGVIAKIRGNGRFEVDVVGESFYAENFETLARRHKPTDNEDESFGDAVLTLDDHNPHDAQAVAVFIEGLQVGHLSRDMARDFRAALKRDGLQQHRQFAVAARLYWGGDERHFSVTLDLPQA